MWLLIKNTLRSFSKTKTALVALVFLVFISAGFYTLLTDINANLQTSYDNIVKNGNLHDLVINEKYDYGNLENVSKEDENHKQVYFPNLSKIGSYRTKEVSFDSRDDLLSSRDWFWVINEGTNLTTNNGYIFQYDISLKNDSLSDSPYKLFKESSEEEFAGFLDEFVFQYQITGCYRSNNLNSNLLKPFFQDRTANLIFEFEYNKNDGDEHKDKIRNDIETYLNNQNLTFATYSKLQNYRYDFNKNINKLTPIVEYVCIDETNSQHKIREKYLDYLNPITYTSLGLTEDEQEKQWVKQIKENAAILNDLIISDKYSTIRGYLTDNDIDFREHDAFDFTDVDHPTKIVKIGPDDSVSKMVLENGSSLKNDRPKEFDEYIGLYNKLASGEVLICPTDLGWEESVGKDNIDLFVKFINDLYESNKDSADQGLVGGLNYLVQLEKNGRKEWGNTLEDTFTSGNINTYKSYLCHMFKKNYSGNKNEDVKVEKMDNKLLFSTVRNLMPLTLQLYDINSYELIMSSGTYKFSDKEIINGEYLEEWNKLKSGYYSGTDIQNFIDKLPEKYRIQIDETKLVIVGVGTTPDFIYPIYNENLLTPNPKNERIYFVNDGGYKMIWTSYRSSPVEKSLFCKYSSTTSPSVQKLSISDLNKWCKKYMSWPENITVVCSKDDTSNLLSPLPAARIVFVSRLMTGIETITYVLTVIILIVSLYVSVMVIKNYITKNKQNFGILIASGISKWKIILSILPFSLIPAIIGAIYGYVQGFLLQSVGTGLFSNYWYHQVKLVNFNFISLCVCIFIALVPLICVSLLAGHFALREDVVLMIKNDPVFPVTRFSLLCKKPFKYFSIFARFRVSLAFSSFTRLLNLSIMSLSAFSIFSFAIANNGKFEVAQNATFSAQNFNYAVDLTSPTQQGGLIKYTDFYSLGSTIDDEFDESESASFNSDRYLMSGGLLDKWANLHFATFYDNDFQKNDILYLKDKVQSKLTLDYDLGSILVGLTNAWDLAKTLMPDNQRIWSDNQAKKLLQYLYENYVDENSTYEDRENCKDFIVKKDDEYILQTDKVGGSGLANLFPKTSYVKMLINAFEKIQSNEAFLDDDKSPMWDYKVAYNTIGLPAQTIGGNKFFDDETKKGSSPKYAYTKINGEEQITKNNEQISIIGIKDNAIGDENYLGPILKDEFGKILNKELFSSNVNDKDNNLYNVIINQVVAYKYKLSVNDIFEVKVTNSYKRFTSGYQDKLVKFKIIGLSSSAMGEEIYTSYNNANAILDVPEIDRERAFNGFYTNEVEPYLSGVMVYSPSGLFPTSSFFAPNAEYLRNAIFLTCSNDQERNLRNTFTAVSHGDEDSKYNADKRVKLNKLALANALGCPDSSSDDEKIAWLVNKYGDIKDKNDIRITNIIDQLHDTYTAPFVSLISYITNIENSKSIFESISSLSLIITDASMGIISVIVFLIVVLISTMLISNAKGIITRMKALGYSNIKIVSSFLAIYVPVIIISLVFSILVVWLLLIVYKSLIFNASQIVLPVVTSWVHILGGLAALLVLFGISFIIGWVSTKRIDLATEIKSV